MSRIVRRVARTFPSLHSPQITRKRAALPRTSLSYAGTWDGSHQMDPRHPLQRIPAGHRSLSLPSGTCARLEARRIDSATQRTLSIVSHPPTSKGITLPSQVKATAHRCAAHSPPLPQLPHRRDDAPCFFGALSTEHERPAKARSTACVFTIQAGSARTQSCGPRARMRWLTRCGSRRREGNAPPSCAAPTSWWRRGTLRWARRHPRCSFQRPTESREGAESLS
ncbi:hypothetical protein LSCM4_07472 [Leishmania orientalis]|uniref:Uncharacterized protein n=1 Tax=Leishmania orientalis TaxID=2249476 RepID=A0A836HAF0_9TRYP|nr:hypothetical protein LSCM4_07472 [Leishmania orientalis]